MYLRLKLSWLIVVYYDLLFIFSHNLLLFIDLLFIVGFDVLGDGFWFFDAKCKRKKECYLSWRSMDAHKVQTGFPGFVNPTAEYGFNPTYRVE